MYFLTSRQLCKMCRKHVLLSLKCLSVDNQYNHVQPDENKMLTKVMFLRLCKMTITWFNCNMFVNLTFVKVMQNLSKCIKRTHKISKDALGSVLLNRTQDAFNELLCQKLNQTRKKPVPFQVS